MKRRIKADKTEYGKTYQIKSRAIKIRFRQQNEKSSNNPDMTQEVSSVREKVPMCRKKNRNISLQFDGKVWNQIPPLV